MTLCNVSSKPKTAKQTFLMYDSLEHLLSLYGRIWAFKHSFTKRENIYSWLFRC